MKRLFTLCLCIFICFVLVSCDNTPEMKNTKEVNENANEIISSDNNNSFEKKTNEQLLLRIENLEKEINFLKETIQSEASKKNSRGAIINALNNAIDDDILIHIERDDGYLKEVHVKVPFVEYIHYDYYVLTGFENNGVRTFNCLIEPLIETSDNPQKIDIDPQKFDLIKLTMSDLKFEETSIALILIIDSNGKEYSHFICSDKFMEGDL